MAYIKTLKDNELVGGTDETDVYPITHTKAIFDSNNKELEQRLAENEEKLSELETKVVYDVTANNNGVNFASLSELLSNDNLSTLIPINVRCGGMSIRFIQSSDNKYVQYRLMTNAFSTTESDWQGVDDEPTDESQNLVKSNGVFKLHNSLFVGNLPEYETRNGYGYTDNLSVEYI